METLITPIDGSLPIGLPAGGNTPRLLYSKRETAEMMGVSVRTIDNLIAVKELRCIRLGRSVRFRMTDIESFLRRDHVTSKPELQN